LKAAQVDAAGLRRMEIPEPRECVTTELDTESAVEVDHDGGMTTQESGSGRADGVAPPCSSADQVPSLI
jgi:hypothetical protein